jgi:hypothetical protein
MTRIAELAFDLWTFGLPVVVIVWATLRLMRGAPARLRYVVTIAGYVAALGLPLMPRETEAAVSASGPISVPTIAPTIAMIWLAITSILLARDAAGHALLWRARRRSAAASDELRGLLEWPKGVPLLLGETPMTSGLLRPAVIVPADLGERFPATVARSIAFHELAHYRWRDPLVYAILRAITALFWPTPLWVFLRWVRREREAAADEMAIRRTAPESYIEALLQFGESARLAATIGGSDLTHRAERILAPWRPRFSPVAVVAIVLSLVAINSARPAYFGEIAIPLSSPSFRPVRERATAMTPRSEKKQQRQQRQQVLTLLPASRPVAMNLAPAAEAEPPPSPPPMTVRYDEHRDVDVHIDRDVHVDRGDGDDTRIVIKNVIRIPSPRKR